MDTISVVVPCYNEEEALPLFYGMLCDAMQALPQHAFELLLVNDGSSDGTLEVMKQLAEKDSRVRYLSFSRNFGKEAALYAGLQHSNGSLVVVMDADGQDPPALLATMVQILAENSDCDCVATRRVTRKGEPPIRSFFARMFYRILNRMSKTEVVDGARDFRMMRRSMVDAILSLQEVNRFSKGLFGWVGFNTHWLEYENKQRVAGETKWSFGKLLLYSIDGLVSFTATPLAISSVMGLFFCAVAFIMLVWIIFKTLMWGDPVGGWPSMACILLFVGGTQLFSVGILGQYLSKAYMETKKRPIYILKESNLDDEKTP